ncbi:MAG: DUF3726 domain-containing protein [Pseudomonadota bacterium]
MSWSLGEIQALTTKAARGAGHPWGVAEEAGWAVRWLSSFGLPGAEAMVSVLEDVGAKTCPISLGIAVADTQNLSPANGVKISHPLVLLPFLSRAARDGQIQIRIQDLVIHVARNGTDLNVTLLDHGILNVLMTAGARLRTPEFSRVYSIPKDALLRLERLAHLTYAPATEASRISGAGAGLTDND